MPNEFVLYEGRPGKNTGSFEVITIPPNGAGESRPMDDKDITAGENSGEKPIVADDCLLDDKETDNKGFYCRLFGEVQRTFFHFGKGARGRVDDPRSLVEASGYLRLECDVWKQNDVLLHLLSTNQYTTTNNQRNEAPPTTSPVASHNITKWITTHNVSCRITHIVIKQITAYSVLRCIYHIVFKRSTTHNVSRCISHRAFKRRTTHSVFK